MLRAKLGGVRAAEVLRPDRATVPAPIKDTARLAA
jgi:hypothetical protein